MFPLLLCTFWKNFMVMPLSYFPYDVIFGRILTKKKSSTKKFEPRHIEKINGLKMKFNFFVRTPLQFLICSTTSQRRLLCKLSGSESGGKTPSYKIEGFWLILLYFYEGKVTEILFFSVFCYFDMSFVMWRHIFDVWRLFLA